MNAKDRFIKLVIWLGVIPFMLVWLKGNHIVDLATYKNAKIELVLGSSFSRFGEWVLCFVQATS